MSRSILLFVVVAATGAVLWTSSDARGHESLTTTVRFDREIVGILNRRCVMCHYEGGPSFALETYEQTWLQRRPIRAHALARHMPPWAAMAGYGDFVNANGLTLRETQFLVSWVEGMGPRTGGRVFLNVVDPAARPREDVRAHPRAGQWLLGTPDLSQPLPAHRVEAGQQASITHVTVDLGLTTERRVRALEFQPGDRRVVRAAFFTDEKTGQWLGSWTPWYGSLTLPAGVAYRLPAGSRVVAEIHSVGRERQAVDQGVLGLFFADQFTPGTPADLVLEARGDVPAGATSHRLRADALVPADANVLALWPSFTSGIRTLEVSARRPDGGTDVLLFAKDIPLAWPTPYIFRKPAPLPAGTRLSVTAYYANPSSSPRSEAVRLTASRYVK